VTDVALQQRRGPDAEAPRTVEYTSTPCALVNEAVGGPRVGEGVERRQWNLDQARTRHRKNAVDTIAVNARYVDTPCITTASRIPMPAIWIT
jgi:hypothetical protein